MLRHYIPVQEVRASGVEKLRDHFIFLVYFEKKKVALD